MAHPTKDSSNQPSLEELLRFKRAERPNEAFWDRFDSELHQRMMRTLVKKDPWPVQLLRGLSGRIAQTTAVVGAAALIAMMVVRPALTSVESGSSPVFAHTASTADGAVAEKRSVAAPSAKSGVPAPQSAEAAAISGADYQIDVVSAAELSVASGVSKEFHLDSIQVASYDTEVYTTDSAVAGAPALASAGVALVF